MHGHKRLRFTLSAFFGLPTPIRRPVIVYQMGKVASSSVYKGMRSIPGIDAFHAHYLYPENVTRLARHSQDFRGLSRLRPHYKRRYLFRRLFRRPSTPIEIITLIREPIARNISAYFQNLDRNVSTRDAHNTLQTDALIDAFLNNYPHDTALNWFDQEFRRTTKVDVYRYPFPISERYSVIEEWPFRILLLRSDLPDDAKQEQIRRFLGIQEFVIPAANVGKDKHYGDTYSRFLDTIRIPSDYARRMLESKYARHFFSEEERGQAWRKWTARDNPCV